MKFCIFLTSFESIIIVYVLRCLLWQIFSFKTIIIFSLYRCLMQRTSTFWDHYYFLRLHICIFWIHYQFLRLPMPNPVFFGSRFCVGDRFYLCDNKILCEYDYEERMVFANMSYSSDSLAHIKRQVSDLQVVFVQVRTAPHRLSHHHTHTTHTPPSSPTPSPLSPSPPSHAAVFFWLFCCFLSPYLPHTIYLHLH